jgi:hypothetical protein
LARATRRRLRPNGRAEKKSTKISVLKKVVRKYLNLKGWGEGHLPKYLILKVVRYQILDSKGLAGGHVIVVVNIILKKMFHVEQFLLLS